MSSVSCISYVSMFNPLVLMVKVNEQLEDLEANSKSNFIIKVWSEGWSMESGSKLRVYLTDAQP